MIRSFTILFFSLILVGLAWSRTAIAAGSRTVTSSGLPVKWSSMPTTVDLESDLDVRGKNVGSLVNNALDEWVNLTDSDVRFALTGLGVAVDDNNICDFFYDSSACPNGPRDDGKNPLVIDDDGTITADFFGTANQFTTLGFASIINFNASTGAAIKGEAVFNASCLSGVEVTPGCTTVGLSFSDDDFTSFVVHEMGHFLGLDHSQVNLTEATDDDSSNDNLITTMFPTFIVGNGGNFKTPERDDAVGVAELYPSATFSSSTWALSGTVYDTDGVTALQCANLVARNQSATRVDAISALSGDLAPPHTADGSYEIEGLSPGVSYTLDVESIARGFSGSNGYTPCRGANGESAPPQFTSFTATGTFTALAGEKKIVNCTIGSGCVEVAAGCSLIP